MRFGNHRLGLVFALSLLLILSLIGISIAVNICPVEKKPTEMSITHSQLPKNEPIGVFNNKINVGILLEWMDRETGEKGPLPGKNVTVTMTILDKYLKMQPDGTFQLVSEESNFVLPTDMNGKIDLSVVVDPFNPKKISYSIIADYIPAAKDSYIGSTANAKYIPTSMPAFSLAACLPLVLVLGMLMGAMYVSGKNPLGALDLSRAAFRVPGVERRAVKGTIKAVGSGIAKGVGGKLGEIASRQVTRFAARTIKQVGGAALKGALKPKTIWAVGKGAVKTVLAIGKFAGKGAVEAYKSVTVAGEKGKVPKVKQSTQAKQVQPAKIGPLTKTEFEAAQKKEQEMKRMKENLRISTKEDLKAGQKQEAAKTAMIQGTEAAGVLPVNPADLNLSNLSVKESWKEFAASMSHIGRGISMETAVSRGEVKAAYTSTVIDTWDRLRQGDLSVLGNLSGGERSQALAARTAQAKSMQEVSARVARAHMLGTATVDTAFGKFKEGKINKKSKKKISDAAFNLVIREEEIKARSRAGEHYDPSRNEVVQGGEIYSAIRNTKYIKDKLDDSRTEFVDSLKKNEEIIGKKNVDAIISTIEKEFKKNPAERFSLETVKEILASVSIKDKELSKTFEGHLSNVVELNNGKNGLVSKIDDEKFIKDVFKAAGHFTSTLSKDPSKICQQYEGTAISPTKALEWIILNEKIKINSKFLSAEHEGGAVYAANNLKGNPEALKSILKDLNLSPTDNPERVKEILTKLLKADLAKYVDTEGSFALIGINAKRISWEESYIGADGKQQTMTVSLPKEDAEKFAKGLKEAKFTTKISEEMKVQDISADMLNKIGITGKSAEKILGELKNEKSGLRANIANSLNIINGNAKDYLGYDLDQLRDGNMTARMEQKLNELGIASQKENITKFAKTGSADSIKELTRAFVTSEAEAANIAAETTASVRMTRENGTLLAGLLESRMTQKESKVEYSDMLDKLREGKIEEMGGALSDFIEKSGTTVRDFEKYVDKLTDFTPSSYLNKGGAGFGVIDRIRDLSISAAEAGLDVPKIKLMADPDKMVDAEILGTFKEIQSRLEGGELDAHTAKIGSEAGMANMKRQAINDTLDGNLTAPKVQSFGVAADINDHADKELDKEMSKVAIAANPKSREQIENSLKAYEDNELKEMAKNIADTAKKLESGKEIVRTEEKFISKDNPLDKSVVETSETVKVYDENVNNTSELFRKVVTGNLDKWKPTESFEHKTSTGGYIDFKNEELAKQRLNTLVVSAIENNAPYEIISDSEIRFKDVSIKVDKDKLYIIKKVNYGR